MLEIGKKTENLIVVDEKEQIVDQLLKKIEKMEEIIKKAKEIF